MVDLVGDIVAKVPVKNVIRVLHGFSVDRPFQAIYRDEQLAPNLKLITWLTSQYAREGARTLKIYIYLSFDCKTCYSAFNGSRQFKNILNGSWQFLLVPDTWYLVGIMYSMGSDVSRLDIQQSGVVDG